MSHPIVTVVCLCYNQRRFVAEAIESVLAQTYAPVQLIVVDDASTDGSQEVIKDLVSGRHDIELMLLGQNVGNCRAFNLALEKVKGKYVVDFAADDVMMPDRIMKQIACFESLPEEYGVVFTDSLYIDENGRAIERHYAALRRKGLIDTVPQGDVFARILSRYFVSGPTMLVKTEVMTVLNGYDEELSYEDFDFWVRSARQYKYAFLDEVLTKVRKVDGSMSTGLYKRGDRQLHSTYLVCRKAASLVRTAEERTALRLRLEYEMRQSVFSENHREAGLFYDLLQKTSGARSPYRLLHLASKLRLPLSVLKNAYNKWRFS